MAYVKCNYSEGMFSSEYFVTFGVDYNSSPFGGMFVNKEDVIPYKEKEFTGLIKATLQAFSKDKAQVSINADHGLCKLWVPKDDLLMKPDELQKAITLDDTTKRR